MTSYLRRVRRLKDIVNLPQNVIFCRGNHGRRYLRNTHSSGGWMNGSSPPDEWVSMTDRRPWLTLLEMVWDNPG